jgi:hypothetical protein
MTQFTHRSSSLMPFIGTLLAFPYDGMRFLFLCLHPRSALAAENLFLRKQLALYQERYVKPRRVPHTTRMALIWLAGWFDWRHALCNPRRFSAGIAKGSAYSGGGNRDGAGHQFLRISKGSSVAWPVRIQRGAKSGSPMSPYSSSACACHYARCASICPSAWTTGVVHA